MGVSVDWAVTAYFAVLVILVARWHYHNDIEDEDGD